MTKEKIQEVITLYRKKFTELDIPEEDQSHSVHLSNPRVSLSHCHGMLDQMEQFLKEDRLEKAFRWLGFIQGCLWTNGVYPLDDLKDHNRP